MPRFMGFVRMEEGVGTPPQALFDAMDTYIGEQAAKGVFLDGGGLYGTEDAVNFVVRKGEITRVDGPYAEAKEVVGGWAIMQYDTPRGGRGRPAGVRRAAREVLARGHRDLDPAPDLRRARRRPAPERSRAHYAGRVPAEISTTTRPRPSEVIIAAWRAESARLVGALTRMTRDVELAEDLAQDALVAALEQWPTTGVPEQPGRVADDHREAARRRPLPARRQPSPQDRGARARPVRERRTQMPDLDAQVDYIEDDVLRLIFLSCHPSLTPESRAALTLRLVGGLTTAEIARGFLATEIHDGPAHLAGQEDADRGPRRVRAARPAPERTGAPRRRDGRDLPDLQRGLHRHRRRGLDAPRPGERGDAARADAGRARARRARGARAAGAAGDPGLADAPPGSTTHGDAGPARGAGPDSRGTSC